MKTLHEQLKVRREKDADKYCSFYGDGPQKSEEAFAIIAYRRGAEPRDELIEKLAEVLEGFRLGHQHEAGLTHIRVMGDSYGWCDLCHERISFGPGEAEQAIAELDRFVSGEK